MCDRVLKVFATDAGCDRLDERFELARLQAPQDSGISLVAEEREELRGARRVVDQGHLGEPTHAVEVVAVRVDELLGGSLHWIGERTLLVEVVREGPDECRKVDVVLRVFTGQPEKPDPGKL